jgi:SAM-dependent methyltransferase
VSLDIKRVIEFYKSPLGHEARRLVRAQIIDFAGDVSGRRVLGLGFATPYLRFALKPAERVLAFMPARQGASSWPREGPSVTSLCDPLEMPLTDSSIDLVIAVHAFEHVADSEELMRELWRICTPNAQLIIVVPRRRGLWSTRDNTPFGFGNPFSRGQLERLLEEHSFEVEKCHDTLYLPPSQRRIILKSVNFFERFGRLLGPTLAGVLVLSARKKQFPAILRRKRAERFVRLPEFVPQTALETPRITIL